MKCTTPGAERVDCPPLLRFRYSVVVKGLSKTILLSKSHEERVNASSLLKQIEKFKFMFIVVLQIKLLETNNAISNSLQGYDMMLHTAVKLLKHSIDSLV